MDTLIKLPLPLIKMNVKGINILSNLNSFMQIIMLDKAEEWKKIWEKIK